MFSGRSCVRQPFSYNFLYYAWCLSELCYGLGEEEDHVAFFLSCSLLRVLYFRAVNFTRVSLVMFSVSPSLPFPDCLTLDVLLTSTENISTLSWERSPGGTWSGAASLLVGKLLVFSEEQLLDKFYTFINRCSDPEEYFLWFSALRTWESPWSWNL